MRKNKGITLIALVITIIVLLILAAVSIATLTGENGILTQANKAKVETRGATVEEECNLWKVNQEMDKKTTEGTAQTLKELLDSLEERNLITKDERKTIEETGKVTIGSRTIYFGKEENQPVPRDEVAPNEAKIEIAENIIIGENIQVTVIQSDNEGGIGIDYNASKWVFNEEKNPLGITNDDVYIGGNFESDDGQQTQITIHVDKIGEYYLHVLSVDKEGNKTETISHKVTVQTEKEAKISMIGKYVDFGIDLNGKNGTTDDWRVFYIGGINEDDPQETKDRIYIIATDYVPNTNAAMKEVLSKNVIEQYIADGYHTYY